MDVLISAALPAKPSPDDVAQHLRQAIGNGVLRPGQRLTQEDLAARLGVSRMPVRAALQRLESEGLVSSMPNCGARVSKLTAAELCEIYEMRVALECLAIRVALPRYTPAQLREMRLLLERMDQQADDVRGFLSENKRFHDLLYGQAERPILLATIENLRLRSDRYLALFSLNTASAAHAQEDHWAILGAIEREEADRASAVLTRHLQSTSARLSALLGEPHRENP